MWYPVAGTTVPYLRNCGTRLLEQWCNSGRNLHLFKNAASLSIELSEAKNNYALGKLEKRIQKVNLLIIDEMRYVSFDRF